MQFHEFAISLAMLATTVACTPSTQVSSIPDRNNAPTTEVQANKGQETKFKVHLENISRKDEFTATNGTKWTLDFSPGLWLVHDSSSPLFKTGQKDLGQGIEAIAEDGNPDKLATSLKQQSGILSSDTFKTAVGALKAGGIRPGQAFEFTVKAAPGQKLSLVTMFGQSNDWFYAPDEAGIALFDAQGKPISGDVSAQINLWNDGTEVDEEPGIGPTQGPRQKAPNTGKDENGLVEEVKGPFKVPDTAKVMRITITSEG